MGSSGPAPAPDKGKEEQVRVILDDNEVSSDGDEALWIRLRLSSTVGRSSGPSSTTANMMAAVKAMAKKEVVDKRAAEVAMVKEVADKEAADKRAAEEAAV
jgi:uncharacterized protein involved in propanediol utilization